MYGGYNGPGKPPDPIVCSVFSHAMLFDTYQFSLNAASAVWPTANLAFFYPVFLNRVFNAKKLFVNNGATASGNGDMGLYTAAGALIVSQGGQAVAGTSTIQEYDITDTDVGPGLVYLAVVFDNTTTTVVRTSTAPDNNTLDQGYHVKQLATAYPLPSDASAWVAKAANYTPMIGMSRRSVI